MKNAMAVFLLALAGAGGEELVARWLPAPVVLPLLLPVLLALACWLPSEQLFRVSVLVALAREVGSGLSPGLIFLATLLAVWGARLLLRRPRPDLPALFQALLSMLATGAVLLVLHQGAGLPVPPIRFLPRFALLSFVVPVLSAGVVTALTGRFLARRWGARFLPLLETS